MELSKRKYIKLKKEIIKSWGFVKLQNNKISEIIECDTMNFFIDDFNYDEFQNFFTGKKSIIVEKISNKSSLLTPIALNVEKVIMSNKNSYMTIISKND